MASVMEGSFASPLADAESFTVDPSRTGIFNRLLEGLTGWNMTLAVLLLLVTYDQCESRSISPIPQPLLMQPCSELHLAEGDHRWPIVEDSIHGAVPRFNLSKYGQVQGAMGER